MNLIIHYSSLSDLLTMLETVFAILEPMILFSGLFNKIKISIYSKSSLFNFSHKKYKYNKKNTNPKHLNSSVLQNIYIFLNAVFLFSLLFINQKSWKKYHNC